MNQNKWETCVILSKDLADGSVEPDKYYVRSQYFTDEKDAQRLHAEMNDYEMNKATLVSNEPRPVARPRRSHYGTSPDNANYPREYCEHCNLLIFQLPNTMWLHENNGMFECPRKSPDAEPDSRSSGWADNDPVYCKHCGALIMLGREGWFHPDHAPTRNNKWCNGQGSGSTASPDRVEPAVSAYIPSGSTPQAVDVCQHCGGAIVMHGRTWYHSGNKHVLCDVDKPGQAVAMPLVIAVSQEQTAVMVVIQESPTSGELIRLFPDDDAVLKFIDEDDEDVPYSMELFRVTFKLGTKLVYRMPIPAHLAEAKPGE